MTALDKKLLRDVRHIWAQALAIALVLAAGVATLILANGAYASLNETRSAYYERQRFADIFATARRVPNAIQQQLSALDGVLAADTRILRSAILDIPAVERPATGLVISLPAVGMPALNTLFMREGRLPDPQRSDEVLVNEAFAQAHGFRPGSSFSAILDGRKRSLIITGTALSPEFIYALGPGDLMPDDKRFGIIWIGKRTAEAAFNMDGAFNSVLLRLTRDANPDSVLDRLDLILAKYGGTGGYTRKDQQSHAFLDAELTQLRTMSTIVPPIFMAVAAFLINMTLGRLVTMEREQIGLMKALGYSTFQVAVHYLKFVLVIAAVGIAIGFVSGIWLGRGLTHLFGDFYHFPYLVFINSPITFLTAAAIGIVVPVLGGMNAIRKIVTLSPAVAMSPPAPTDYSRSWANWLHLMKRLPQQANMILRHFLRFPVRAGLTVLGVASSGALLVLSFSPNDSVEFMIDVTYFQTYRQDLTVSFSDIKPRRALDEMRKMPGVLRAEGSRSVPATFRYGQRSKRMSLQGIPPEVDMQKLLDLDLQPMEVPKTGVAISEKLAEILGASRGDTIEIQMSDKRRRRFELPITAILQGYLGLSAFVDLDRLNTMTGDGNVVTSVDLKIDPKYTTALYTQLKETPAASAIMLLRVSLQKFRETLAQNITMMMTVYIVLAVVITFGVVYNSARIQLSERGREFASLRVLGFTRAEISRILLGEIALIVLLAIPLSWLLGYVFTWYLIAGFDSELYRVPFVIERATYAFSSLIMIAAAVVSGLIVRRRIDRLDLIEVLNTRE